MTIDELKLIYETTESTKVENNEFHLLSDIVLLNTHNLHPSLLMDENGNISYELKAQDILNSSITIEDIYSLVSKGWKLISNNFIYKM